VTKASDNAFPSILITEGTEPSAPAAGKQRLYIDSTTHHLKRTDSGGTDVDIETAAAGAPADAKYIVGAANGTLSAEVVNQPLYDNFNPDAYPASPNALDDEFEGSGSLDGKWTAVNNPAGGDAMNQTDYPGYLHVGLTELGTDNWASLVQLYQTAPTGTSTMTFTAKVCMANVSDTINLTDAAEFAHVGIGLINSTNSQSIEATIEFNDNLATDVDKFPLTASASNDGVNGFTTTILFPSVTPSQWVYIRLRKTTASAYTSANTYEMDFSLNGMIWHNYASGSKTFTTACARVGLIFRRPKSATGTPKVEVLVDWFRRTA